MISKYLKVLLFMGGFFLLHFPSSTNVRAEVEREVVAEDRMIFKVARSVYSQGDLLRIYTGINDLGCLYPDSLLQKIFKQEFQSKNLSFFQSKIGLELLPSQKAYFLRIIPFMKLLTYSKSQSVVVNPSLSKYFYLSAKRSSCSVLGFKPDKSLKAGLAEILRLEVFVRSRFLPSEKSGKSNNDDTKKAIVAAQNLMKSIGRQVEEEVYW
jgi:hypothetical protein